MELRNYLRNALICLNEVEMFSCQVGAEEQDKQHALKTSPEGIARAEFFFKDGQHVVISPGKYSESATEAEKCLQRVTQSVPLPKSTCISLSAARRADFSLSAQA